ncbi:MAG: antA/AntB antirepressor family protein [Staphylococcus equorum]|nr:antA/AntB antirepressor family protein [Staphylococcus equorum]
MKNVNELFNLKENQDGTVAVSGRELHKGLEIQTPYKQWIDRMIDYGFEVNTDYIIVSEKVHTQKSVRAYEQENHIMTLDMGKEIAMIQRSDAGKNIRRYFIEIEKSYRQQKPLSTADQIKLIAQGNSELNERIDTVEDEITDIRENTKLDAGEYGAIAKAVSNKVAQIRYSMEIDKDNKKANKELFQDINTEIKRVAGVSTRSQLKQKDFENVMELIRLWQPSQSTVFLIRK